MATFSFVFSTLIGFSTSLMASTLLNELIHKKNVPTRITNIMVYTITL